MNHRHAGTPNRRSTDRWYHRIDPFIVIVVMLAGVGIWLAGFPS